MAARMATSYGPQAAQVNEESPSDSSLDLTLIQYLRNENREPREMCTGLEVCVHLEVEPPRT
jgi:hypothetical protein